MPSKPITTRSVRCIKSASPAPAPQDAPSLNDMVLEFFEIMDVIEGVPEPGAPDRPSVVIAPDYDPTAEMFRMD